MRVVLTCLLVFGVLSAYAQVVAVQNDKQNIVFVGMDNPMRLATEKYPCKSLVISTDNGKITGKNGNYNYVPDHPSNGSVITIKAKTSKGLKVISRMILRVHYATAKVALIGGKDRGEISVEEAKAQTGIDVPMDRYAVGTKALVIQFNLIVSRNGKEIFNKTVSDEKGVNFSTDPEVASILQTLLPGDRIKITNITCKGIRNDFKTNPIVLAVIK